MTELPKGWALAKIGDVLHGIRAGKSLKCVERQPLANERGVIKVSAVTWGSFDETQAKTLPVSFEPAEDTSIKAGNFLFSRANTVELVGAVVLVNKDHPNLFLSDKILRLDLEPSLKPWLLKYLQSLEGKRKLAEISTGNQASMRNIGQSGLKAVSVPLPPLNEQRRIVEKIEAMFERIDKGVENLRAARTTLVLYRQSLLKSAFEGRLTADWRAQNADKLEDPKTLLARIQKERDARYKAALDDWQTALTEWRDGGEKGKKPAKPKRPEDIDPQHIIADVQPEFAKDWTGLRLGELNINVSDGPFGSNLKTSDYTDSGVQVVRLENIGYGEFIEEKQSFVSHEKYETIARHSIYPGTIVVSSFVTDAVRSCVVPESVPVAINKADCFAVVLDGAETARDFVAYYLQSPQVFKQLEGLIHGVGRPRINTTQLKELHFPICSPTEQTEITRILNACLDAADKMEAEIDAALTRADALRQSILKQAFAGKLVPQDPNDEPATTLLARIKAELAKAGKTARKGKITA